ncbi:MAG: SPOR domain-containing protein [Pseudomonadota bacterium]
MEEEYYESSAGRAPTGHERMRSVGQTLSTWIGAAAATAVLVALGTWFYHLGVRDAQQVPIIQASTQPVKVRPADPGGEVTPHQNIDSYNAGTVAEEALAETQLAEPPAAPTSEDVAMADLRPEPKPAQEETTQALGIQTETDELGVPEANDLVVDLTPEQQAIAEAIEQVTQEASAEAEAAEPAEEPATEVAAVVEPEAEPEIEQETEVGTPAEPASSGNPYAPDYSPPVVSRPSDLRARTVAARETAEATAELDETALEEAAEASSVKIQLQASPSRDTVIESWSRIRKDHADLLGEKALVVELTQSGGKTFYRLRLGPFADRAEAVATCQALRGRGQDCIVAQDG